MARRAAGKDKAEAAPEGYARRARSLSRRLSAPSRDDKVVWEVYSETEKLIAVMRFRLGYETPGRFTKLPSASDLEGLVARASSLLDRAADEMDRGGEIESIETLRDARNNLRSYLGEKKKPASRRSRG